MEWNDVLHEMAVLECADSAVDIGGVEYDSRRVGRGDLFVAMRGGTADGNRFIDAAIAQGAVVVNAGLRVPVPSFEGAALRSVVEKADAVGLRVQAVGSGLAREQVPAAGTMVPAGTEVVVRFAR